MCFIIDNLPSEDHDTSVSGPGASQPPPIELSVLKESHPSKMVTPVPLWAPTACGGDSPAGTSSRTILLRSLAERPPTKLGKSSTAPCCQPPIDHDTYPASSAETIVASSSTIGQKKSNSSPAWDVYRFGDDQDLDEWRFSQGPWWMRHCLCDLRYSDQNFCGERCEDLPEPGSSKHTGGEEVQDCLFCRKLVVIPGRQQEWDHELQELVDAKESPEAAFQRAFPDSHVACLEKSTRRWKSLQERALQGWENRSLLRHAQGSFTRTAGCREAKVRATATFGYLRLVRKWDDTLCAWGEVVKGWDSMTNLLERVQAPIYPGPVDGDFAQDVLFTGWECLELERTLATAEALISNGAEACLETADSFLWREKSLSEEAGPSHDSGFFARITFLRKSLEAIRRSVGAGKTEYLVEMPPLQRCTLDNDKYEATQENLERIRPVLETLLWETYSRKWAHKTPEYTFRFESDRLIDELTAFSRPINPHPVSNEPPPPLCDSSIWDSKKIAPPTRWNDVLRLLVKEGRFCRAACDDYDLSAREVRRVLRAAITLRYGVGWVTGRKATLNQFYEHAWEKIQKRHDKNPERSVEFEAALEDQREILEKLTKRAKAKLDSLRQDYRSVFDASTADVGEKRWWMVKRNSTAKMMAKSRLAERGDKEEVHWEKFLGRVGGKDHAMLHGEVIRAYLGRQRRPLSLFSVTKDEVQEREAAARNEEKAQQEKAFRKMWKKEQRRQRAGFLKRASTAVLRRSSRMGSRQDVEARERGLFMLLGSAHMVTRY